MRHSLHISQRIRTVDCGLFAGFEVPALVASIDDVERWSWFFDQFYAAQRADFGFMSRCKPPLWFLSNVPLLT